MMKGFKVKLYPTKEQRELFLKSFGTSRWVYNWALGRQKKNFDEDGRFLSAAILKKEITMIKKQEEYKWLNEVSAKVAAQAVIDSCNAFQRFFYGKAGFPKFKRRRDNSDSFFQREDHFIIEGKKVLIEKIGYVKMGKSILPSGVDIKYYNPRVKYDGIDIWLTVAVEVSDNQANLNRTEPIGIDLGIKTLAVCSNGKVYKKPSIEKYLRTLKRLQCKANRIFLIMERNKVSCRNKSKRLVRLEKRILKTNHRITNILNDNIHKMTAEIIKAYPASVVIEDLDIRELVKNKFISDMMKYLKLGEIIRQIKYKCAWNGIRLIIADRWFPSSKTCSCCGNKKEKLSLSERVFVCEKCGLSIDRDLNAALNLKKLAM